VAYVEKLIVSLPNMMALAAEDVTLTGVLHTQPLPPTPRNTAVAEFPENCNADTLFPSPFLASTEYLVGSPVAASTVDDGDTSHHHDSHQPVDLAIIRHEITCMSHALCTLIATLSPPPTQPAPLQLLPPAMTMTISMDNDNANGPHHDGHQQPMDLIRIQQEIQENMISM